MCSCAGESAESYDYIHIDEDGVMVGIHYYVTTHRSFYALYGIRTCDHMFIFIAIIHSTTAPLTMVEWMIVMSLNMWSQVRIPHGTQSLYMTITK